MNKNFMAVAKLGESERDLMVSTDTIFNAYTLLKKQKINKKWGFSLDDMYEVNCNWEKVEEKILEERCQIIE